MSENTTVPTPTSATAALINELKDDREVVLKAIAAYRKEGVKGLLPLIPELAREAKEDIQAAMPAIPEIKAGYRTTEFWLVVGVLLLNFAFLMVTGKEIPLESNLVVGGVVAVYTAFRSLSKK